MTTTVSELDVGGGWELARPAVGPRLDPHLEGTEVVGFRDRGAAGLDMRVVPHPGITLVVDFGDHPLQVHSGSGTRTAGALVAGLSPEAVHIRSPRVECIEVRLSPLRAHALLGVPSVDLGSSIVDLEDLWVDAVDRARAELAEARGWDERFAVVDALLAQRRPSGPALDAEVAASWELIVARRGRVRIDDLATFCGWSRKRLWSRFSRQIGLSPKRAAMLVRFDGAVQALAAGRSLAEIAAVCGYVDQSHLHRDVAAFTGSTPAALARELRALPATPSVGSGAFVQDAPG